MTITVRSIAASVNPDGQRIDTLLLKYPRCIHSEFMTHRVFSRNAASSRAIPVEKLIQSIIDDPFIPHYWGSNKPGMQAGEECNADVEVWKENRNDPKIDPHCIMYKKHLNREDAWRETMFYAIEAARGFANAGYHKQIINRLLEPFAHITVLCTATEWNNFFDLRCHEAAEPHMSELADKIRQTRDETPAKEIGWGAWHLPFEFSGRYFMPPHIATTHSVACCASTSYKTVDDFDMTEVRAKAIFDKLLSTPLHASPFEHPAMAQRGQYRNFTGWLQYRILVEMPE